MGLRWVVFKRQKRGREGGRERGGREGGERGREGREREGGRGRRDEKNRERIIEMKMFFLMQKMKKEV